MIWVVMGVFAVAVVFFTHEFYKTMLNLHGSGRNMLHELHTDMDFDMPKADISRDIMNDRLADYERQLKKQEELIREIVKEIGK